MYDAGGVPAILGVNLYGFTMGQLISSYINFDATGITYLGNSDGVYCAGAVTSDGGFISSGDSYLDLIYTLAINSDGGSVNIGYWTVFEDLFQNTAGTISAGNLLLNSSFELESSVTSPQFRIKYNPSNYLEIDVGATGVITLEAVGSAAKFKFNDTVLLRTGSATAGTVPAQFTSGALLTTAVVGGQEFLTDKFYGTITTGAARKEYTLNDIALTSGRVSFATTNGRLTDSSVFTFSAGTLSATTFSGSGASLTSLSASNISSGTLAVARGGTGTGTAFTTGSVVFAGASGVYSQDNSNFAYNSTTKVLTSGVLDLPTTSSTLGQIRINGTTIFHALGTQNIFLGKNTGNFTTSGTGENVALGDYAGNQLTTGFYNSFVGYAAGYATTTGEQNTFFGWRAGAGGNGAYNSAFGSYTIISGSFSGSANMAFGIYSLQSLTSGSYNAGIGYAAFSNATSGGNNIGIGALAGSSNITGSGNILIGTCVDVPSSSSTALLNIGNVLFGLGMYNTLSPSSTPTSTGAIGIGVNATATSRLTLKASSTTISSLNIESGVAPTSPVNGDIWFDGTDIKMRVGGVTKVFTLV